MRNKHLQFAYLRERICTKLKGWSTRFFSMGGLEVHIKAVLQAIPSYAMSCSKIPDSVCYVIEQACARFWWHDSQDKRGLHWVSWKHMFIPKSNGGLGSRNLAAFNKALLAKKVCRIVQHPNSLMARVLKAILNILISWWLAWDTIRPLSGDL